MTQHAWQRVLKHSMRRLKVMSARLQAFAHGLTHDSCHGQCRLRSVRSQEGAGAALACSPAGHTHVATMWPHMLLYSSQALRSDIGHRLYTAYTILYPVQYAVACRCDSYSFSKDARAIQPSRKAVKRMLYCSW